MLVLLCLISRSMNVLKFLRLNNIPLYVQTTFCSQRFLNHFNFSGSGYEGLILNPDPLFTVVTLGKQPGVVSRIRPQ